MDPKKEEEAKVEEDEGGKEEEELEYLFDDLDGIYKHVF